MLKGLKRIYIFVLMVAILPILAMGQDFPQRSNPPRMVNDFAELLTPSQEQYIERKLVAFADSTTTQISVVTVNTLSGYEIGDYATRLAEEWGVGQKGRDNGVMIVVKPKTLDSYGEVFIAVGYGLEGVLPDITAGRIVSNVMIPAFSSGNIAGGIDGAVDTIMSITSGEFSAEDWQKRQGGGDANIVVFVIIAIVILSLFSRRGGSGNSGSGHSGGGPIFIPWGSPRGGGSSSGGFGGGGFGGFGGGSFGGGGAGGRW